MSIRRAAQAADAAELAARRDPARRARVARLLAVLDDLPAALKQRSYTATRAGIGTALSELLTDTIQPGVREAPGPPADDWRALVAPFAQTGIALGLVRPRTLCQYERDTPPDAPHEHRRARPCGVYALHLPSCPGCTQAEAQSRPCPECPIHILAALCEGVWPVWEQGPPPTPTSTPCAPDSAHELSPDDAAAASALLEDQVARGCGAWLIPAEVDDPAACAMVANVAFADITRRTVPEHLLHTLNPAGQLDVPAIARAAAASGEAEASAYVSAAALATNSTPAGRRTLQAAWQSSLRGGTSVKRRLIERLDTTVNDYLRHMGVTFPRATDILAGATPGQEIMVDDAVEAYRAMPVSTDLARWLCLKCPTTGRIFRPARLPFGYAQSCAAYSAFTALIKEAVRITAEARGGGLEAASALGHNATIQHAAAATPALRLAAAQGSYSCTGVVDDIFGCYPAPCRADAYALRQTVFTLAGYTRSAKKHRAGSSVALLGLLCTIPAHGPPCMQLQGLKLYQTLLDAHKLLAIATSPIAVAGVPVAAFEAFVGDVGWWGQLDEGVALRCPGVRAALFISKDAHRGFVSLDPRSSPAVKPLQAICTRALDGLASATRVIPAGNILSSFRISVADHTSGLQARADAAPHALVACAASDASLEDGTVTWALLTTAPDGAQVLTRGARPAVPGESSASAEAEALRVASRSFSAIAGATFIPILDALALVQALLARRTKYGTPLFDAIQETLINAEQHGVQVLPVWVPRTLNTAADATTHLSPAQARAWADANAVRVGHVAW